MVDNMNKIVAQLNKIAREEPNKICFKDGDFTYTYGQLKKESDALAVLLAQRYKKNKTILIYGGMEHQMFVSYIACMKSGHAYAPVDNQTPIDRIELMIEVSDCEAVITWNDWPVDEKLISVITKVEAEQVMSEELVLEKSIKPVTDDETIYIIFTSGTTGVPKGVQISYSNLINFLEWCVSDFDFKEGDNFLAQVPYSFDVSVMITYSSLLMGGVLIPITKELISDYEVLFNRLEESELDVWISTPSFVEICLMNDDFNGSNYPNLRKFLLAGEELKHKTASELVKRFPNAKTYNAYGPTEATVIVTKIEITQELLNKMDRLPIGYIKPGTDMFTMLEGKRLPDGEKGELIIAGPTVSKGYINNSEKTNEVFFDYEGTPAYHTGDAAIIEDGIVYYRGRIDFQIKFHGYRMELEDIEYHLRKNKYVKSATVVPKYKDFKVQRLVAYIIPEHHDFEKEFHLAKYIKNEMKELVMEYMIPQTFIFRDELPLTQNGKIDRKHLISEVND